MGKIVQDKDMLVEIPENRRRYFGGEGLMLLPGRDSVEAALRAIASGHIRTTANIGRELASAAGAQGTCPMTLRRVLRDIVREDAANIPWWRAVCAGGAMFASAPGGREEQARRLKAEGVSVCGQGKDLRATD